MRAVVQFAIEKLNPTLVPPGYLKRRQYGVLYVEKTGEVCSSLSATRWVRNMQVAVQIVVPTVAAQPNYLVLQI
jgi:hypothetical protein